MKAGRRGFYFRLETMQQLTQAGMTNVELPVWWVLIALANEDGVAYPSRRFLMNVLGLKLARLRRVLRSLEKKGFIRSAKRAGRASFEYHIDKRNISTMKHGTSSRHGDHFNTHDGDRFNTRHGDHFNTHDGDQNGTPMGIKKAPQRPMGIKMEPHGDQNGTPMGIKTAPHGDQNGTSQVLKWHPEVKDLKILKEEIKKEERIKAVQGLIRSVVKRPPDLSLSLSSFSEEENPTIQRTCSRDDEEDLWEVRAYFSGVWGKSVEAVDLSGDDRERAREALRAHGLDGVRDAIRGHHRLATRDGSQRGKSLRHVFPPRSEGNQVLRHELDHGKFADLRSEGEERLQVTERDLEEERAAREKFERGMTEDEAREIRARVQAMRKDLGLRGLKTGGEEKPDGK